MNVARLRKEIELKIGYSLKSPKDCDTLSKDLRELYDCNVRPSNLKKLYGFSLTSTKIHFYTLDLLCHLLGYSSWNDFCLEDGTNKTLPKKENSLINKIDLTTGKKIIIEFLPEKKLLLEYLNNDYFLVLESLFDSEIKIGFKLEIKNIVKNFPLVCHTVYCPFGNSLGSIILGKEWGVQRLYVLN